MSLQDDLIKLTRTDEINQRLKAMENGERIKKKVGSAYENGWNGSSFDNNGNGGKDGPDSTDNSDSSQEDKDNGNDTSKKADEEINKGDDMGMGLGGLFDCDSGQCINVNFNQDYKRKPKGWEEQCKPPQKPTIDGFYYQVRVIKHKWGSETDVVDDKTSYFNSAQDAVNFANSQHKVKAGTNILCSNSDSNCKDISDWKLDDYDSPASLLKLESTGFSNASGIYSLDFGSCKKVQTYNCYTARNQVVNSYVAKMVCNQNGGNPSGVCENAPNIDRWPDSKCSEIQTNATGTNFEMACKEYDKNMPKRFTEGSFSEMELCDKDDNKVKIKRTVKGFEITQDKYGTTAIVDPSSYKVTETHKWRR
jgi:hypothetical protein